MTERRTRKTTALHFHCYLLRSLDPRHPILTYIGFTTNPHRRLQQHNGVLKNGGARKTKRKGRPWEFVAVVHGFQSQRTALQFEWAWQHPHKSIRVRGGIGDEEAKKLGRKRGPRGQLEVLKCLLEEWSEESLRVHFVKEEYRSLFENVSGDLQIERSVLDLIDMPFWSDRNKRVPLGDGQRDDAIVNGASPAQVYCQLCSSMLGEAEDAVSCGSCDFRCHEYCLGLHCATGFSVFSVRCPSCRDSLDWRPDTDDLSLASESVVLDFHDISPDQSFDEDMLPSSSLPECHDMLRDASNRRQVIDLMSPVPPSAKSRVVIDLC